MRQITDIPMIDVELTNKILRYLYIQQLVKSKGIKYATSLAGERERGMNVMIVGDPGHELAYWGANGGIGKSLSHIGLAMHASAPPLSSAQDMLFGKELPEQLIQDRIKEFKIEAPYLHAEYFPDGKSPRAKRREEERRNKKRRR